MHDAVETACAALTLVESLIIHLQECGCLSALEVDAIYDAAINAHVRAGTDGHGPPHIAIAKLLAAVRNGNNGVRMTPAGTAGRP